MFRNICTVEKLKTSNIRILRLFIIIILLVASYMFTRNYSIFHLSCSVIVIILGFSITILAINTYDISENSYFTFLGIVYAFVCCFKLMHVLTEIYGLKSISQQLNYISNSIDTISLIISFRFLSKKLNVRKAVFSYWGVSIFFIFILFFLNKYMLIKYPREIYNILKLGEILKCILVMYIMYKVIYYKNYFSRTTYINMLLALIFMITGDILYIIRLYHINLYILIHLTELSFYHFLFEAIIINTLKNPFEVLFNGLKKKNEELNRKTLELKETIQELNRKNNELEIIRKEIQKNAKKYESLIELLPEAVAIRKGEEIVFCNSACARLAGASSKEEIEGKSIFEFVHIDYKNSVKGRILKQEDEDIIPFLEEKLVNLKGEVIDVEISAFPFQLDGENLYLIIAKNITEIKKQQEIKKELKETVEKDKLRTEFFANLSHEFKTPINVIYSALQVMELNTENNYELDKGKYIKIVRQNCYRLMRIVNNLIDMTKIDAGFYEIKPKNYNIVNIVENTVMSVSTYVKHNNMEIIFDTLEEEIICACDLDTIERIILNLISNSVKYGRIHGLIKVSMYEENHNVFISVKDNGIGIPKNKQKAVFHRFVRIDESLARTREGSGIGLSLVKSLVEINGGEIKLISEQGVGSEFIIKLPIRLIKDQQEVIDISQNILLKKVNIEFSDIYH